MIEIKKKKFEIEEDIKIEENDNILYQFKMQITDNELLEIKKIIFEDAEKKKREYAKASLEERKKIEEEIEKQVKEREDKFEKICFKEHLDKVKECCGEYKFNELIDELMGFFINFFVEKQVKPYGTMITNLKSHMNRFGKLQ